MTYLLLNGSIRETIHGGHSEMGSSAQQRENRAKFSETKRDPLGYFATTPRNFDCGHFYTILSQQAIR